MTTKFPPRIWINGFVVPKGFDPPNEGHLAFSKTDPISEEKTNEHDLPYLSLAEHEAIIREERAKAFMAASGLVLQHPDEKRQVLADNLIEWAKAERMEGK